MQKLSAYILTKNSEKYLDQILTQVDKVADEILILDSGSLDDTESIARRYSKVRFEFHPFSNFKDQRNEAASRCTYDIIFFLDSDELPDDEVIAGVMRKKQNGFNAHAYKVERVWHALGRKVHCVYPVVSPDRIIRIFDRRYCSAGAGSNLVHESITGYSSVETITGKLIHRTFHDRSELSAKLEHYTDIACIDLINHGKSLSPLKIIFSPIGAFIKWYLIKGNVKDGMAGLILAGYAARYSSQKYKKAIKLKKSMADNRLGQVSNPSSRSLSHQNQRLHLRQ